MPLTRDQLVAAAVSRSYEDIQTHAGVVRVGVMSGVERAEWDNACSKYAELESETPAETVRMQALLVCLSVLDAETGSRMFQSSDAEAVASWQAPILWTLYRAAWRVNLLGGDAVEEQEKN